MKSTSTGATALMIAAQDGRTETVAKLLAQGADVNAAASDGSTALIIAAQNGHTETVSALLLRKDINVDAKISAYRLTALFLAAQNGHAEIVSQLLAQGADFNARASDGSTALMVAAENGHAEIVAELLAERTDLMYVDHNGHVAVELSTKRANVNAVKKSSGYTALMFAVQNGHAEIVSQLLAQGADFNARASDDRTALMVAAENGHTEIVSQLLAQGADVNAAASDGGTALMVAAQNGRAEIVAELLDQGADVNVAKRSDGATALIFSAQDGHAEIVARLLAQGADFNARASHGGTALIVAAQNGHAEIVAELLDQGADVNAAASDGATAFIIAAQNGHTETILALLSSNGVDWREVRDQLRHPSLRNLNKEVSFLLAVIIPDKELRNSIIASFNQENPRNAINQENNDILGAGLEMYKTLKDLKSWHKRYLTDPDSDLGLSENKAEISANKRFFYLLNHQDARQEALARNDLITALVSESASLAINSGVFGDEDALGRVRELTPEDFYTLTTKIIDSGKDESVIPKLQALSLVAALQKDREDHPRTEISPASATRMKGQAGLCIVS